MMNIKNIKNKNGLLWLVFCVVVVLALDHYYPQGIGASTSHQGEYPQGFLNILDARGHGIEKHVGKSDTYLRNRLKREDISAASTFNDMAEAEHAIRTVLVERAPLVQAWLRTERSNRKAFYWKMNAPVGRVLHRGWSAPRPGNQVRVVLIRGLTPPYKFSILTTYPERKKQ